MQLREILHLCAAAIIFTIVAGFSPFIKSGTSVLPEILGFSILIIALSVAAKKITARMLDADIEHELWSFQRFGFKPHHYFPSPIPAGIILPLFLTIFSLGFLKFPTLMTYEGRALKRRAARRFGFYSYAELTDWHNAIIGASGMLIVLLISVIGYVSNFEVLANMAAFYAFANMIPFSKLDGSQILFGSRILWSTLAVITLIFFAYALII